MSAETDELEQLTNQDYKYGFVTDIEQDSAPRVWMKIQFGLSPQKRKSRTGCLSGV